MNSISRHLTPRTIYAQIRMERQKHKGVFFLMEGSSDFRRFEKFVDRSVVSVITCIGKENVEGTIEITQDMGFDDCLGFVDLDFDYLDNCVSQNDDVIQSANHDFDIDICKTEVISRYLSEMADAHKLGTIGGGDAFVLLMLEALKPLSALRYANFKKNLRYDLSRIEIYKFFNGHAINIEKMIEEVSKGKFGSKEYKDILRGHIDNYMSAELDLWHFTNGHDLICAVGISLQGRIGDRAIPQTKRVEVERHLRLAFDFADFHACGLAGKILSWEGSRTGLPLLRKVA